MDIEKGKEFLARRNNPGESYDFLLRFPRYLEIETVNACNARCPMCTIDCISFFLKRRQGDVPESTLYDIRKAAAWKFKESGYWRIRDRQFGFSAFLDGDVPVLNQSTERFFKS